MYFFNDKKRFNDLYRKHLIAKVRSCGFPVTSVGVFDGLVTFLSSFLKLNVTPLRKRIFLSSNLRTNLLLSLYPSWSGVVIVNGLGRYRSKKYFRAILIRLIIHNPSKKYVFQNCADYRWARRYSGKDVFWVPGSGGVPREISSNSIYFTCVLRPSKLAVVKMSLIRFAELLPIEARINLVGICSSDLSMQNFEDPHIVAVGYQDQSKVISFGGTLFVPDGYGEGIPHVLVDALVSGLPVILSKKSYTKYGLSKLSIKANKFQAEWVVIDSCPDVAKEAVGEVVISERYFSLLSSVS